MALDSIHVARGPPRRYDVMKFDTDLDEMVLTFASDEGLRGGKPEGGGASGNALHNRLLLSRRLIKRTYV
jgi:hypothetical protein